MSNTPKHTHGPWKVEDLDDTFICSNDGKLICKITAGNVRNPANYPLIAAAPEMLEALELANELLVRTFETNRIYGATQVINQVKNAIKKAKGEQ